MPPHQRIGNALGQVGHLSLAVAFQNLALIYLCSRFVTPWAADFCVFAAVTLVFDFVYHLTFFVAVLSVDVQRTELSDSLQRVDSCQRSKKSRHGHRPWMTALWENTLPLSTRFAGTVAIFSIILAVNWHFFDIGQEDFSLKAFRQRLAVRQSKRETNTAWNPPPINQARTPADWLRIQDHNTARELFGFIKPGAHSFIACIYDPLLVVSKGAHGRDRPQPPTSLGEGLRRFARGHAFPAALMVVFLIAGVTLLMNYLLWTGLPDSEGANKDDDTPFSVKTLPTPQSLDIVRLVASLKGHLASISLDRSTALWLSGRHVYTQITLPTATTKPKLWPILAIAMDDSGNFLALCTDTGQIGLWNITDGRFSSFPKVEIREQAPALFSFVNTMRGEVEQSLLIIVSPDGHLIQLDAHTGMHRAKRICVSPIVSATLYICEGDTSVISVSKLGAIHVSSLTGDGGSTSQTFAGLVDPASPPGNRSSKIKCVQGVPSLGLIFALHDEEAEMFDFKSRTVIHAFQLGCIRVHSFRVLHSTRYQCACGGPSVRSLTMAYSDQNTGHMIMQTFTSDASESSPICLGKPSNRNKQKCRGLECAKDTVHCVEPAGVWESTCTSSVVGIRLNNTSPTPRSTLSGIDEGHYTVDAAAVSSALKQRARKHSITNKLLASSTRHTLTGEADSWEAWTLSTTGEFRSRPLLPDDFEDASETVKDDLLVATPGPIVRLGKRSVAVAFGNTVKIITLGMEAFDGVVDNDNGGLSSGFGSYRIRKGNGRKVQ
jgi:hypothetical protein